LSAALPLAAWLCAAAPAADLVDVTARIPDAVLDLRYATADNFLKRPLYPQGARCLLRGEAAEALVVAASALRAQGYRLRLYDCYRPASVQKVMFEAFPHVGYVADPARGGSVHNRAAAVDLGLVALDGSDVPLPTAFDVFGRAAWHGAPGTPPEARRNRERLLEAMESAGFRRNRMEWWHYEWTAGKRWPRLDVSFTR
jgi:D-alanyl-D-alanine dipeptidase